MPTLHTIYCGDEELKQLLNKASAQATVSQIYGLFYGCLSAPHEVSPSHCYPLIFGKEDANYDALDDTTSLISNLIALWDLTKRWNAENEFIALPNIRYSTTYKGTITRLRDNYSMIEYFVKGLDFGHVAEKDFSKGGFDALKTLSETGAFIHDLADLMEKEKTRNNEQLEKALESVIHLEEVVGDCIARMNLSLKKSRDRENMLMKMLHETDTEIPGDAECPCDSGKKYRKCCGIMH